MAPARARRQQENARARNRPESALPRLSVWRLRSHPQSERGESGIRRSTDLRLRTDYSRDGSLSLEARGDRQTHGLRRFSPLPRHTPAAARSNVTDAGTTSRYRTGDHHFGAHSELQESRSEVGRNGALVDDRIAAIFLRLAQRLDLAGDQRRPAGHLAAGAGLGHGNEIGSPRRSEL